MSIPPSTSPGWYPDAATGGTAYWDGKQWTGDRRPPRKAFAAASNQGPIGGMIIGIGVLFSFLMLMAFLEEGNGGYIIGIVGILTASVLGGIYLLRGEGPTTEEVEARLREEERKVRSRRRWANVASVVSSFTHRRPEDQPNVLAHGQGRADQVQAVTDPQTARALQNLQNLQYTRVLSQEEFQAAKNILLGEQPWGPMQQLDQLAELHRTGVLGDIEFSAAKARLLGL